MTDITTGLLRRDLLVAPRTSGRRRYWLIHDPLRRQFLRVGEREFDQLRSGQIADPRVLAMAQQNGLLAAPGRPAARRRPNWANPLFLPIAEFRLGWLIECATQLCSWIFSPLTVAAGCLLIAVAAASVLFNWSALVSDLPTFAQFFGPQNWLPLLAVLAATKVLHELGHAVACRRLGARCDSVGLVLLCFTPCLYCDVTDAWRLPRRSARAAVIAAGIYVELLLASVAALLWMQTVPGTLHFLCLNIMFVCGVSSLMFNGNPLMRYDGYYLLSDLIDATNLRLEAAEALQRVVQWMAGVAARARLADVGLATYHVASAAYRLVVFGVIGAWLFSLLDGIGLRPLAVAGCVAAVAILCRRVGTAISRWLGGSGPWSQIPRRGRLLGAAAAVALLVAVLLVPLPHYVAARGAAEASQARAIYVTTPGVLEAVFVEPGESVGAGQLLARLSNPQLEREQLRLAGREAQLTLEIEGLQQQSFYDPAALEQLATREASLEALRLQRTLVERQLSLLELRSPIAGELLPPRGGSVSADEWLERFARGQSCDEGYELYCVAAPDRTVAVLRIAAEDRPLVGLASPVRLCGVASPAQVCDSTVESVSEIEDDAQSSSMAMRTFEVRCRLLHDSGWPAGTEVHARIDAGRRSIAVRLWQAIRSAWRG